ncbi:hypothetical protein N7475_009778 [Penicillium sp. IBT 31633x]|nr:hypothetical protein N7475_009778 [Penicillium sp. IBT 31633x]
MAYIYHLNQPPNLEDHPCSAPLGHRGHPRHRGRRGWNKSYRNECVSPDTTADENTNYRGNVEEDAILASDSDAPDNYHYGRIHYKKGRNNGKGPGRSLPGKGGKGIHGHGPHIGPYELHGHNPHPGMYAFPGHHHGAGLFGFGLRRWGHHHHKGFGGLGRHHGRHHGGSPFAGPFFRGPYGFLHRQSAEIGFSMVESNTEGVDFKPPIDIFDTTAQYIVHVSLPGAKKSDLSIDYNANGSVLHMAGVLYRPGINEDLHQALVVGERDHHVGVFEREVRLGSRSAPASVVVDRISAKLEDGILVVTLPKIGQYPTVDKKVIVVEDGDLETEKDATVVDERVFTPSVSEASTVENGEAMEYVKVHVQ